MMTTHSRLQICKKALLTWRANVKREEQRDIKLKMRQLSNIQNIGQGQHMEANK